MEPSQTKTSPMLNDHTAGLTSQSTNAGPRPGLRGSFVPQGFVGTDWAHIQPLINELLEREINSSEELEQWLQDRSDLEAAMGEDRANLYIATTCHTDDEQVQTAFTTYLDEVSAPMQPLSFQADQRQAELSERYALDPVTHEVLIRNTRADVELFREENVPLNTEVSKLSNEYQRLNGKMTVEFEGGEMTLPMLGKVLQENDRARREAAWRTSTERRLQDRDEIDRIYTDMRDRRNTIATNAGEDSFTLFNFKSRYRFDYGVEESLAFHDAVEKQAVPFLRSLNERRRQNLGVQTLRPWDTACDEEGREPLRPFKDGQEMVLQTREVFDRLDPELGDMFRSLGDDMKGNFDLDSRKGKSFGGYQSMRMVSGKPFIFMNTTGTMGDARTMVHEAGHAFHSLLCFDRDHVHERHAPIEFCEVASMTMELLTIPHWDVYLPDEQDRARAIRDHLEHTISFFPWCATIDAFQHWVYANPNHTTEERTAFWLSLDDRFGPTIDWSGLEASREAMWHRQGHVFGSPFYYIEYGIAQLGALGIWLRSLTEGVDVALADYKKGLALGGSRPLPELFEASGVPFDFSQQRLQTLFRAVQDELAKLPE